jgi:hypothetical protein
LLVLIVDYADLPGPDSLVNPYVFVDGLDLLNLSNGTNAKDTMKAAETDPLEMEERTPGGMRGRSPNSAKQEFGLRPRIFRYVTCIRASMSLLSRLEQYHSESRPTFVLVTEFVAFVGTMATLVGMAVLFSLFQ